MKSRKKKRPFRAPRGAIVQASDGRWRIEIDDVADLDKKLGRDVLEALLACLISADRLGALAHFIHLCKPFDRDGAIWQRNVTTAHYLTAGVLRELAMSTKTLRGALWKRGWYKKTDPKMVTLRAFEDSWDADRRLISVRDKVAFHVDGDVISSGLKARASRAPPLVLMQSDGSKQYQCYSPLAHDVVFEGLDFSQSDRRFFMQATSADSSIGVLLRELVEDLLDRADIPLKHEGWEEGRPDEGFA